MTFIAVLLLILGLGLFLAWRAGLFAPPRTRLERSVRVDHLARRYIVWLPGAMQRKKPLPVVLAFHGAFTAPTGIEHQTALHLAEEAAHFIIVYAEGYKRSWNAGTCCGPAMRDKIDEAKFVRRILDDLETIAGIDRRRIYATGFSNGARLCYFLAATIPDVIAAIAPVGGAVALEPVPKRPVPVFHIHGLDDRWSPFYGGPSVSNYAPEREPVEKGIEMWRRVAGATVATHESLFDGAAECTTYTGGPGGVAVRLCRIPGLGHHWPGVRMNEDYRKFMSRYDLGPTGPAINVCNAILRFLGAQALPEPPARRPLNQLLHGGPDAARLG